MEFSDLSIIVQGPIIPKTTENCLLSIKRYAPGAKIILSTWEGSNISNLNFDQLVLNPDPGADFDCFTPNPDNQSKPNNLNRQIISTINGLHKATTKYSLKFRTDFVLTSDYLFRFYTSAQKVFISRDENYSVFKERILTFGIGNVHTMGLAYHLADYVHLGLTEDLVKLWDTPLLNDSDANYFRNKNISRPPRYFNFKLASEQKIWIECLKKNGVNLNFPNYHYEINDDIIIDSEKSIINNFIFIDYYNSGISSKFVWMDDINNNFSYRFGDFLRLYNVHYGINVHCKKLILSYKIHLNIQRRFFNVTLKKLIIKNSLLRILHKIFRKYIPKKITPSIINNKNKIFWLNEKGSLCEVSSIPGYNIRMLGSGNTITISTRCLAFNNTIFIDGSDNSIIIGKNGHCLANMNIFVGNNYHNRLLNIGENAMIMGANIFLEEDNNKLVIGNNLTCSDDVLIQCSDGHVIYDKNKDVLNSSKNGIVIGNNVWIGRRSTILKDVYIPDGCIIAAGSIVVKRHITCNSIIGGNPARILKENVSWTRDMFNQYQGSIK